MANFFSGKTRVLTALSALLLCSVGFISLAGCNNDSNSTKTTTHKTTYDSTVTYTEDATVINASYTSTGTDENAIVVEDGTVDLDQITVNRDSSDSSGGNNASFYGEGAAILAKGGIANIDNATIATDARGGAGVFAYGGGEVHISDSSIATS